MGRLIRYIIVLLIGIAIGFYMPEKVQKVKNNLWQKISDRQPTVTKKTSQFTKESVIQKNKIQKKASSFPSTPKNVVPVATKKASPVIVETKTLFTVQVGSFTHKHQAQLFVDQLHEEQIDAYIAPQDLEQNQKMYRIYVGEYLSKRDAEIQQVFLSKRFTGAFVKSF